MALACGVWVGRRLAAFQEPSDRQKTRNDSGFLWFDSGFSTQKKHGQTAKKHGQTTKKHGQTTKKPRSNHQKNKVKPQKTHGQTTKTLVCPFKTPPCVRPKRLRVSIQNVPVCTSTTRAHVFLEAHSRSLAGCRCTCPSIHHHCSCLTYCVKCLLFWCVESAVQGVLFPMCAGAVSIS